MDAKRDNAEYIPDPLELRYGLTLPTQLTRKYARRAAGYAKAKQLEDGSWFATISGFRGVWEQAAAEEEALGGIEGVVLDWVLLKLEDGDGDLPIVDGIDLNFVKLVGEGGAA